MEHPKIPRMMTGGTPLLGNLQILTKKSTWGLNFNHFMGIFTGTYNPKLMILACIFGLSTVSTHWFPGLIKVFPANNDNPSSTAQVKKDLEST